MPKPIELVGTREASKILGVSRVYVSILARAGEIDGVKRPGGWIFSTASLRKYIERRKKASKVFDRS